MSNAKDTLESTVDDYLVEWLEGLSISMTDLVSLEKTIKETVVLNPFEGACNWVNREGNKKLYAAARLLLRRLGEQRRVSVETARSALIAAHSSHLEEAKATGTLSEHVIIADALERVKTRNVQMASTQFQYDLPHQLGKRIFGLAPRCFFQKKLPRDARGRIGRSSVFEETNRLDEA